MSALGRGLSSLLDSEVDSSQSLLSIGLIDPNQYQPRTIFDEESIASLAKSIKEKGIIQPIVVRERQNGRFELIVGERRLRAAKMAEMLEIPAIIRNISDKDSLELAILENVQREELSPIDEAEGYMRLTNEFGHTQEDVAKFTGKSRSYIANFLRLLNLPKFAKQMLAENKISVGHAKIALSSKDPDSAVRKIMEENLTVRQSELKFAKSESSNNKHSKNTKGRVKLSNTSDDNEVMVIEEKLTDILGANVSIKFEKDGSGKISLEFENLAHLDGLLKVLVGSEI